MDKIYKTEFHRTFLIEALPAPLTRASRHLQLFDNYIANTRMRLRSIRDPQTKGWTYILQQRAPAVGEDISALKIADIYLNEAEYDRFKLFEDHEIRKNRYFHEFDRVPFEFDVFLGNLWGLNMARIGFENAESLNDFEPPLSAVLEVSKNPFFYGDNLVSKKFVDVQAEVMKSGSG